MIIGPTLDCYWNVLQSDGGDTWTYFHICSYMFNSLSWNKSCGCHVSSGATDDPMEIGGMPTDAPKKMSTGSKTDWVMWSMWSMARGKDGKGFGHQLIGSLFSAETAFFQRLASLVLDVLYSIPLFWQLSHREIPDTVVLVVCNLLFDDICEISLHAMAISCNTMQYPLDAQWFCGEHGFIAGRQQKFCKRARKPQVFVELTGFNNPTQLFHRFPPHVFWDELVQQPTELVNN